MSMDGEMFVGCLEWYERPVTSIAVHQSLAVSVRLPMRLLSVSGTNLGVSV